MQRKVLRLATRKSPLALVQAGLIKQALEAKHMHVDVEICPMETQGDTLLDQPLAAIGGKGLFTESLEKALFANEVDIAVHSMKDLPVHMTPGLCVPVITQRDDPHDAFISFKYARFADLPEDAVIGTASLRRQAQLLAINPHFNVVCLRGNVQTRLQKCENDEVDAIILAAAGLKRLSLAERINEIFTPDVMLPAVGQGALGIQCRNNDKDTQYLIQTINCETTHACVSAERAVNEILGGNCSVPIAMHALRYGPTLSLRALVGKPDGSLILRAALSGAMTDPHSLGHQVAAELISQGARDILDAISPNHHLQA